MCKLLRENPLRVVASVKAKLELPIFSISGSTVTLTGKNKRKAWLDFACVRGLAGFLPKEEVELCRHPSRRRETHAAARHRALPSRTRQCQGAQLRLRRTYEGRTRMGEPFGVFRTIVNGRAGRRKRCAGDAGRLEH